MFQQFVRVIRHLWLDDTGSVIATEYLALGTIVALGSIAGLDALRDSTVDEMREYGRSVRSIRQQYRVPGYTTDAASKQGAAAQDSCPQGICP